MNTWQGYQQHMQKQQPPVAPRQQQQPLPSAGIGMKQYSAPPQQTAAPRQPAPKPPLPGDARPIQAPSQGTPYGQQYASNPQPDPSAGRMVDGRLVKDEAWARSQGMVWSDKQSNWVKPGSDANAAPAGGGYGKQYVNGRWVPVAWNAATNQWAPASAEQQSSGGWDPQQNNWIV
jgi:hypothetical protein